MSNVRSGFYRATFFHRFRSKTKITPRHRGLRTHSWNTFSYSVESFLVFLRWRARPTFPAPELTAGRKRTSAAKQSSEIWIILARVTRKTGERETGSEREEYRVFANESPSVYSRVLSGCGAKKIDKYIYIYIRMYNKDVVRVVRFSIYFINTHSHARARARRLHYILLHSDGGSEQQQVDWNRSKSDSTPDGVSLAIVL